jgi:hypothetical protein
VVCGDGVVLHEGDDDEATAIGEGSDLEGHPGQRSESTDRSHVEDHSGDERVKRAW